MHRGLKKTRIGIRDKQVQTSTGINCSYAFFIRSANAIRKYGIKQAEKFIR